LFVTGFALTLLGLALAAAPQLSWQLAKVTRAFASMGLDSGAFVASGLGLSGLGLVARVLIQSQATAADAGLRAALEALHADVHVLHVGQARLEQLAQRAPAPAAPSPMPQVNAEQLGALFRMAASLDQLGVKLQRGLKSEIAGLEERLGRTHGAAPSARASSESAQAAQAAASPSGSAPSGASARAAAAPAESLGVLDEIDDLTVIDEHGCAASATDGSPVLDLDAPPAAIPARAARADAADEPRPAHDLDALLPESAVQRFKREQLG
jgi:hypothetical protein